MTASFKKFDFDKYLVTLIFLAFVGAQNCAAENQPAAMADQWQKLGNEIIHRMVGDDCRAFFGFSPKIAVKTGNFPSAFAEAPSEIILSSALLPHLRSSSEFAFVLAHELAHISLGHTTPLRSNEDVVRSLVGAASSADRLLVNEIEADALALKLLKQGGFDPIHALRLLTRIGEIGIEYGTSIDASNPGLVLRRKALISLLSGQP